MHGVRVAEILAVVIEFLDARRIDGFDFGGQCGSAAVTRLLFNSQHLRAALLRTKCCIGAGTAHADDEHLCGQFFTAAVFFRHGFEGGNGRGIAACGDERLRETVCDGRLYSVAGHSRAAGRINADGLRFNDAREQRLFDGIEHRRGIAAILAVGDGDDLAVFDGYDQLVADSHFKAISLGGVGSIRQLGFDSRAAGSLRQGGGSRFLCGGGGHGCTRNAVDLGALRSEQLLGERSQRGRTDAGGFIFAFDHRIGDLVAFKR